MSLPHEDAARKEYPTARKFIPVHQRSLLARNRRLLGWTFEVDREGGYTIGAYAWISCDHRITSDPVHDRATSASLLRSYTSAQRTQQGGNVIASGNGSVASGGSMSNVTIFGKDHQ